MWFRTDILDREFPQLVSPFIAITGIQAWDNRLSTLARQLQQNPLLNDHFLRHYPIELAIERQLRNQRKTGKIPMHIKDVGQYELYAFITMVTRVYQRLRTAGQKRLAGMIRNGLDSEHSLAPLQHEMSVATHVMSQGFDVEFYDRERYRN